MAATAWWLSLQHDWYDGFKNNEKVWVSAHNTNSKTCHSFLTLDGPTDGNFTSNCVSSKRLKVTHTESGTSTQFLTADVSHKITPNNNPTSLDMTSTGGLGAASAGKDVLVFEARSGIVRRKLTGHLADVGCVKFFPSNLVLLSGGSDMCLKIWSVQDGSCPVTLAGHKRGITALEMIDRGRNILSASLDGTIKLWSCGGRECLSTISSGAGSVNAIALITAAADNDSNLLLSVTDTGSLFLHSLQDNTLQLQYKHTSELTACVAASQFHVVAGSTTGDIITLDLRNTAHPLSIYKRSNYAITALCRDPTSNRVWCSQKDGECYTLNTLHPGLLCNTSSGLLCDTSLSGGDCETVYNVVASDNTVMTTAKDRVIRRYEVL